MSDWIRRLFVGDSRPLWSTAPTPDTPECDYLESALGWRTRALKAEAELDRLEAERLKAMEQLANTIAKIDALIVLVDNAIGPSGFEGLTLQ